MHDAIARGTGNSRYLRSIAGFMQLYPTYEDFAAALVAGTLPVDLNGINPDGFDQLGTALDKANLLTDSTAALMGLTEDATVNDALAALGGKVNGLITFGTAEMKEGDPLPTGTIYIQYE